MLSLIVTILFALAIAYFAIQNTIGVTLVVANNILPNVPLYFVVISSVLVGIILASIISGLNALSAYQRLRGKEKIIAQDQRQIHDLQEKVSLLEARKTQLTTDHEVHNDDVQPVIHEEKEEQAHRPSFFHNLFHPKTETR
ncbi:MAG: hypothetical protein H0W89_06380 [Candidatus Levybacteria bacterium]|nr:hypothetical protein [Candidatus Levybacteria bacterium]